MKPTMSHKTHGKLRKPRIYKATRPTAHFKAYNKLQDLRWTTTTKSDTRSTGKQEANGVLWGSQRSKSTRPTICYEAYTIANQWGPRGATRHPTSYETHGVTKQRGPRTNKNNEAKGILQRLRRNKSTKHTASKETHREPQHWRQPAPQRQYLWGYGGHIHDATMAISKETGFTRP